MPRERTTPVLVLGGGLTGLAAGYTLARAGTPVSVLERDSVVGGLSRTVEKHGFRFDLGGHRFFTTDGEIDRFVRELLQDELITVGRTSKIYLHRRFFDYPLKPLNAMFGLGISTTLRIFADYARERMGRVWNSGVPVSLEDWVVRHFGRAMFDIYFREYSEKVWGIPCDRISAEWVAQRIRGLSLTTAVKNAFFRFSGRDIPTLADRFIYPRLGIGRISERLREEIERSGSVHTVSAVRRITHRAGTIREIEVETADGVRNLRADAVVSSIPLSGLVRMLDPLPPDRILQMAAQLKYRDIVIVAIMVKRSRVTDQTWIYIPERHIPFGRIHEPTNWSADMAPEGSTLLVTEYFSFRGDEIWSETDERLTRLTVEHLCRLGFIKEHEVTGSEVVRASGAYPLFEVGFREVCDELHDYLGRFENLRLAGRVGMFRYYNMDHAIRSGMEAARAILGADVIGRQREPEELALAAE